MPMYSSAESETKLRNMHVVNHRELPVAKFAARVADFLWPKCQDEIDEAMAKAKEMQRTKRVYEGTEEEVYEPPEVPHVLPVTRWSVSHTPTIAPALDLLDLLGADTSPHLQDSRLERAEGVFYMHTRNTLQTQNGMVRTNRST